MIKYIILKDMFSGTLEQFKDCFFDNVDKESIKQFAKDNDVVYSIIYGGNSVPYSVIHEGKVVDIKYKKVNKDKWHQSVWVGDILLGQLFHMKNKTWSVVSNKVIDKVSPIYGFKNKRFATEYLLSLNGY